MAYDKQEARVRRHIRIRKKLSGTKERPRLSIYRGTRSLNAQIIDDVAGKTIFSISTLDKNFKGAGNKGGNVKGAVVLGELIAKKAQELGITVVVFDRGGYVYHGRIKAFAESARKAGLKF